MRSHRLRLLPLLLALALPRVFAQAPAKPAPDVLVFKNGDRLTGHLERAQGGNVVFNSDMAGELTVSFDKIQELRSGTEFALLPKGVPLRQRTHQPQGTVELSNGELHLTEPGGHQLTEPTANVDYLIDQATYRKEIDHKAGFTQGWNGTLTGGATLVRSTTSATTLTAGATLVRALPTVPWLAPRNRTTVDLNESYGKNTSPGAIPQTVPPTPSVTTLSSIFHADSERDEYLSPRVYALADLAFDHNYAQGLQFQQIYGGGVGYTAIKSPRQELDLKADVHYEKQQFITAPVNGSVVQSTPSQNIIGSTLFEGYHRNLPRKIVFTETANILPGWNDLSSYSANVNAAFSLPIVKRLSATLSTIDNYLNDPAPGYRRNSIQFITAVTYTLK